MKTLARFALFILAIVLLVSLASFSWLRYYSETPSNWWSDARFLDFIQNSTKIEIIFRQQYSGNKIHHPAETLEITDRDAIDEFVSAIRLIPKKSCECAHLQGVIFWKDGVSLRASICNHCFDIGDKRWVRNYQMPPKLYETFLQLAKEHNKKIRLDP